MANKYTVPANPCDKCKKIKTHVRDADGHDALKEVPGGHSYRPFAQAAASVTHHKCKKCGTIWKYDDDRNDEHTGWSKYDPEADKRFEEFLKRGGR